MAKLADSEETIWRLLQQNGRLREQVKSLTADVIALQQMLAVLAGRADGVLVFEPSELAEVPPGAQFTGSKFDGRIVLRLVSGESESG